MYRTRTVLDDGRIAIYDQLAPTSTPAEDGTAAVTITAGYHGPVHLYVEAADDQAARTALEAGAELASQLGLLPAEQASAAR